MKKWRVYGTVQVGVTMTVEAESEEEAIDSAEQEFPGLSNYAGNGGMNQIVGVHDASVSLDSSNGDMADFTDAEEIKE